MAGGAVQQNGIFSNPHHHSQQPHMESDPPDSRKRPLETPTEASSTKRTNTGGECQSRGYFRCMFVGMEATACRRNGRLIVLETHTFAWLSSSLTLWRTEFSRTVSFLHWQAQLHNARSSAVMLRMQTLAFFIVCPDSRPFFSIRYTYLVFSFKSD